MDGHDLTETQRRDARLNLLRFTALNALSFEVLAGQILILFARQVGASLGEIGLLAALLPFASVIQLGVAPLVARFGPRRLMLAGWCARNTVAAGLFLVPIAAAHGGPHRATHVLLLVMAGFYFCRAIGLSSWLPIIQEIVPPIHRGNYLSQQEWLRQVSIVLIAVVTAVYLIGATGVTRFMHVIAVGVIAGVASLCCLAKVPDVGSMAESIDREYLHRAMAPLRDPTFVRYLSFSCLLRMLLSAYAPFVVVFLREGMHLSTSLVIAVNTVGCVGAISTLGAWGRWTDRVGSKPALAVSIGGVGLSLACFMFARSGAMALVSSGGVLLLLGVFTGGLTVSMSKFELAFIPIEGRAHFVAMNVTLVGLTSAAAALTGGKLLQALRGIELQFGWLQLDRFRIYFLLAGVLLAIPWLIRRRLPEEHARSLRTLVGGNGGGAPHA